MAQQVHGILGKATQPADETIRNTYQRIERTGKTSKAMAAALAQVFETTVEILQGGDVPEDSISEVELSLKWQAPNDRSGSGPAV